MLPHTQVVDLRRCSARRPYRIQKVTILQRFSQSPHYHSLPRWAGIHDLYHKYVVLFMFSYGSNMSHAVASIANIFVDLFAPVRLHVFESTRHANRLPIRHHTLTLWMRQ